MVALMDACEVMSTPGTEANEKLYNAFYGTYDNNFGERRLKSYFELPNSGIIILPRGGLEGRCNLIIQEGGEALDSGRYSRKDRHSAVPPDEARLAEIQIEADENFQTRGEIKARKDWAAYKEKRGLTEQHIRTDFKTMIFVTIYRVGLN